MNKKIFDTEDYRLYINLLQENINRMSSNSASCKTWLISIITALLAIQTTIENMSDILPIAVIPTFLFYFLDSYYLGLEKRFIVIETNFINKIKMDEDCHEDLYSMNPQQVGTDKEYTWKGLKSYSTWPFYSILIICVLAISLFQHSNEFFTFLHGLCQHC